MSDAAKITDARLREIQSSDLWARCFRQLNDIGLLEGNWDDQGAQPIRPEIINTAKILLIRLIKIDSNTAPCRIVASPSESICIEWQLEGRYIEVEIEEPFIGEWMIQVEGKPTEFKSLRLYPEIDDEASAVLPPEEK